MSRLTANDIVQKGDYLQPGFNPATLTVSQLLGILHHHDIKYPMPYNKPRLIQCWNENLTPHAQAFLNVLHNRPEASDDGVTNGLTGELLNERPLAPRRASRRSSRQSEEAAPVASEPAAKRSRSSAQPRSSSRASSRHAPPPKTPAVENEQSESDTDLPPRKVSKGKKKKAPEDDAVRRAKKGRISLAEDSGWEYDNVFQSGPDDSSPVRASSRSRRSSARPRTKSSRKSTSLQPPDTGPSSSTSLFPETEFAPSLPEVVVRENEMVASRRSPSIRPATPTPEVTQDYYTELNDVSVEEQAADPAGDDLSLRQASPDHSDFEEDAHTAAIAERIASGGEPIPMPVVKDRNLKSSFSIFRILFLIGVLAAGHGTVKHKNRLADIGYCESGGNTNQFLEELKLQKAEQELCVQQAANQTDADALDSCTPPDVLLFLHPMECLPCPQHGACTQHTLSCDKGFLLRTYNPFPVTRHATFSWNASTPDHYIDQVKLATSNLWPYALPQCVPDPTREAKIGYLGRGIRLLLAQERGKRLCDGDYSKRQTIPNEQGGEAKRWGLDIETLKEMLKKNVHSPSAQAEQTFDDTFNEAIQQITSLDVFIAEDKSGHRYIAHTTPKLSWNCSITVSVWQLWDAWRLTVLGVFAITMVGLYAQYRRGAAQREQRYIAPFIQATLEALQDTELAHHADPVTNIKPYFVENQLRDYVLQDEHSLKKRKHLWEKVARTVTQNGNIRISQEEVDGDEVKVWRWMGNARRKSIAGMSSDYLALEGQ